MKKMYQCSIIIAESIAEDDDNKKLIQQVGIPQ